MKLAGSRGAPVAFGFEIVGGAGGHGGDAGEGNGRVIRLG